MLERRLPSAFRELQASCRCSLQLRAQPPQALEHVAPGRILAGRHDLCDLAVREVGEVAKPALYAIEVSDYAGDRYALFEHGFGSIVVALMVCVILGPLCAFSPQLEAAEKLAVEQDMLPRPNDSVDRAARDQQRNREYLRTRGL